MVTITVLMLTASSILLVAFPLIGVISALQSGSAASYLQKTSLLAGLLSFSWLLAIAFKSLPNLYTRTALLSVFVIWNALIWPKIINELASSKSRRSLLSYFAFSLLPIAALWLFASFLDLPRAW